MHIKKVVDQNSKGLLIAKQRKSAKISEPTISPDRVKLIPPSLRCVSRFINLRTENHNCNFTFTLLCFILLYFTDFTLLHPNQKGTEGPYEGNDWSDKGIRRPYKGIKGLITILIPYKGIKTLFKTVL